MPCNAHPPSNPTSPVPAPKLLGRPGTRQASYEPEDGEEAVPIYLSSLSWENPRDFGEVYVALRFWQRLGLGKLFSELLVALLYDLTSTYFEGSAEGIEKAKRGYSRDSRPDAKQVTIGVVVDWDGYPVGYEVFEGNIRDHATVAGTLANLKDRFGVSSPTVCMDRGMVTKETLSLLRDGYLWIVTESREKAREYALKADAGAWQVIRRDESGAVLIEVQEIGCEEWERLILVRSAVKERGIHDRLLSRMKKDLESLAARVQSGKLKVSAKIERAVGRIFERYPGMSRWVVVEVLENEGKSHVEWQLKTEYSSEVRENEGVYVLRTNLPETSPEDVLLSYMAYVLLWSIEHTHRSHGGTLTGRRVLDVLSGIELATITLRAGDGRRISLEKNSLPAGRIRRRWGLPQRISGDIWPQQNRRNARETLLLKVFHLSRRSRLCQAKADGHIVFA
ncbi:MAG: IS1634 family transposase [Armatimonadetes bacterium]|nr:IS1634 family transposase [Armatimonadota bacterium]